MDGHDIRKWFYGHGTSLVLDSSSSHGWVTQLLLECLTYWSYTTKVLARLYCVCWEFFFGIFPTPAPSSAGQYQVSGIGVCTPPLKYIIYIKTCYVLCISNFCFVFGTDNMRFDVTFIFNYVPFLHKKVSCFISFSRYHVEILLTLKSHCLTLTDLQFFLYLVISNSACDYYRLNLFSTLPLTQTVITSYTFLYTTHFGNLTLSHFKIICYSKFINKSHALAKFHPILCLTFLCKHKDYYL